MKRLIIILVVTILSLTSYAKHVDNATARLVAQNFWKSIAGNGDLEQANLPFSNIYLFQNTANTGFVLVAADDVALPILGYSTTNGVCTPLPDGAQYWMSILDQEIAYAQENGIKALESTTVLWNQWINGEASGPQNVVNQLVQTTWDQSPLYNNLCPYDNAAHERTVTGCVATAMAQVMKYHNHPAHGVGGHSYTHARHGLLSADFAHTQYDWEHMPTALTNSSTQQQKTAVSTLMYHCGVAINMDYDISSRGGSGAYTQAYYPNLPSAETALKLYFGYVSTLHHEDRDDYSLTDWNNQLKADLDASRPIIYNGRDEAGGHCFVCDGYNNSDQFHFNWGWSGYYDGYYTMDALNPGAGGTGGNATYTFNIDQGAIFGMTPNNSIPAAPCTEENTCHLTIQMTSTDELWAGSAIQITNASGYIYDNVSASTSSDVCEVMVCNEPIYINWISSIYDYVCGFTIRNAEGATIYSHQANHNIYAGRLATVEAPCGVQASCDRPTQVTLTSTNETSASLSWNGNASSYYIEYGPAGFLRSNGQSATVTTTSYTINGLNSLTSYDVYVAAICPDNTHAFANPISFTTGGNAHSIPWIESFEGSVDGWTIHDGDGDDSNWSLYTDESYARTGSKFIASSSYENNQPVNADNWIISPAVHLPANEDIILEWYDRAVSNDNGYVGDHYNVYISTTGDAVANFSTVIFSGATTSASYTRRSVNLTDYAGQTIHLAFRHQDYDVYMLLIDDISIKAAQPCEEPTTLIASNTTATTATLTWQCTGSSYEIEYGPYGFILGNGATETASGNSITLTDLEPGTQYQFYVTNMCDGAPTRSSAPGSFSTNQMYTVQLIANGNGFMGTHEDDNYVNHAGETFNHMPGENAEYYILSINPQGQYADYGGRLEALYVDNTQVNLNSDSHIQTVGNNYNAGGFIVYKYTFTNIQANHIIRGNFTNTPAVGIEEAENTLLIYPNPTTSQLNIEGSNIELIEVYDMLGRKVLSTPYTQVLNVTTLANGFYTLRITTPMGVLTHKFEKR